MNTDQTPVCVVSENSIDTDTVSSISYWRVYGINTK